MSKARFHVLILTTFLVGRLSPLKLQPQLVPMRNPSLQDVFAVTRQYPQIQRSAWGRQRPHCPH